MEVITIESEAFLQIMQKMEELKQFLSKTQQNPKDSVLDNQQFIQLMNISKRTAQTWRDEGIIAFSQVGSKVYYRLSDVQQLLDSNYRPSFKKK